LTTKELSSLSAPYVGALMSRRHGETRRNTMNDETVELSYPAYWASAIINGDTSGLNEAEEMAVSEMLELLASDGLMIVDVSEHTYFARFDGLLTDMADYTAIYW
jgi:hypothetical protein